MQNCFYWHTFTGINTLIGQVAVCTFVVGLEKKKKKKRKKKKRKKNKNKSQLSVSAEKKKSLSHIASSNQTLENATRIFPRTPKSSFNLSWWVRLSDFLMFGDCVCWMAANGFSFGAETELRNLFNDWVTWILIWGMMNWRTLKEVSSALKGGCTAATFFWWRPSTVLLIHFPAVPVHITFSSFEEAAITNPS